MTTAPQNISRLQIWAQSIETKTANFAAWTVDNSGITRIIAKERFIDSTETTTTANQIKKIAVAFFTGLTLLAPAVIGFTAQKITAALSKVWTSVIGKPVDPEDSSDSESDVESVAISEHSHNSEVKEEESNEIKTLQDTQNPALNIDETPE